MRIHMGSFSATTSALYNTKRGPGKNGRRKRSKFGRGPLEIYHVVAPSRNLLFLFVAVRRVVVVESRRRCRRFFVVVVVESSSSWSSSSLSSRPRRRVGSSRVDWSRVVVLVPVVVVVVVVESSSSSRRVEAGRVRSRPCLRRPRRCVVVLNIPSLIYIRDCTVFEVIQVMRS